VFTSCKFDDTETPRAHTVIAPLVLASVHGFDSVHGATITRRNEAVFEQGAEPPYASSALFGEYLRLDFGMHHLLFSEHTTPRREVNIGRHGQGPTPFVNWPVFGVETLVVAREDSGESNATRSLRFAGVLAQA
jgi:hypothetical protein